jgi:nucleoside-diphosphate-sugar epimerase
MSASEHWIGVTGAGGFIGRAVVNKLHKRGLRVRAWLGPPEHNHSAFDSGVVSMVGALDDSAFLNRFTANLSVLIHCAGPPFVSVSWRQPAHYIQVHAGGSAALAEAALAQGVSRWVLVSSAEVYGAPHQVPVSERAAIQPRSPYAVAKAAAEQLWRCLAEAHGITAVLARPFCVYGPGMNRQSLLGTIADQLTQQTKPLLLNDLRPVRDFCFVDDVAEALVLAALQPLKGVHAVNMGSGQGFSVSEFAKTAMRLCGRPDSPEQKHAQSEIYELVADISKARELLGWQPRTSLQSGIRQTLTSWEINSCAIS